MVVSVGCLDSHLQTAMLQQSASQVRPKAFVSMITKSLAIDTVYAQHRCNAMSTFQDRVRELKGFLGKLLPRTATKTRRSAPETSEEVGAASQLHCCPIKQVVVPIDTVKIIRSPDWPLRGSDLPQQGAS